MKDKKLNWIETYKEMALSDEDRSDWERIEDGWNDLENKVLPRKNVFEKDTKQITRVSMTSVHETLR